MAGEQTNNGFVKKKKLDLNYSQNHCACVWVTMKKVPDEWQARQAILAILQVSSSKRNAKKITTRVRCPNHQSITAILRAQ